MKIPFNRPGVTGHEIDFIRDAIDSGKLSGNGKYTQLCQDFFVQNYQFKKCLLTTSCTDALEMAAILLDIQLGDEVILPSYTFVSTANAFVLRGATLVFADSMMNNPNIDVESIERLITPKTKAIIPVHYAGVSCDMKGLMKIATKYNLFVVEDAAQAIDSFFINEEGESRPLGGIGHLAAFSFHETKNVISGEGGMLVINDDRFVKRAEIIWEKGTNRSAFFRGEVDKYGWVDVGSSFLPSELISAFLYSQLNGLKSIQARRRYIWSSYNSRLKDWAILNRISKPYIPNYATNNAHMYYLVFPDSDQRASFIDYCKKNGINVVFHYLSLHKSEFYKDISREKNLPNSDMFSDCLVRLPIFGSMTDDELEYIISTINKYNAPESCN